MVRGQVHLLDQVTRQGWLIEASSDAITVIKLGTLPLSAESLSKERIKPKLIRRTQVAQESIQ